jgi:hypothetical protein
VLVIETLWFSFSMPQDKLRPNAGLLPEEDESTGYSLTSVAV